MGQAAEEQTVNGIGLRVRSLLTLVATVLALILAGAPTAMAGQRIELNIDRASIFNPNPGSDEPGAAPYLEFPASPVNGGFPIKLSGDPAPGGSFALPGDTFAGSVTAPGGLGSFTYSATGYVTGSYDSGSGEMTMSIPMAYTVHANMGDPEDEGGSTQVNCRMTGFTAEFATQGSLTAVSLVDGSPAGDPKLFEGRPFEQGEGSLLGRWEVLYGDLIVKGIDGTSDEICGALTGSPTSTLTGSMWLLGSVKVTDEKGPDDKGPDEKGPDEKDPDKTPNTRLSLSPAKRQVAAGKKTKFKLRVRNLLDTRRKVKVTFKSSNRRVKVRKSIVVNLPPRTALVTTVKVKATRKAKGKAKITAKAAGQTAKAKVIVKKAKRG